MQMILFVLHIQLESAIVCNFSYSIRSSAPQAGISATIALCSVQTQVILLQLFQSQTTVK